MTKRKVNKVIKGLEKASKTHAQQAKTLKAIKFGKGGSAKSKTPSNVANPSLYQKVKSEAKRKFDVFPSAYASAWLVKTYKKRGGKYKGAKKAEGGEVSNNNLRPIPAGNKGKGLSKLPTKVRNKMGFMQEGGKVKKSDPYKSLRQKPRSPRMAKAQRQAQDELDRIVAQTRRQRREEMLASLPPAKKIGKDPKGSQKRRSMRRDKPKKFNVGGGVTLQARGCGAIMNSKRKPTRVPRS